MDGDEKDLNKMSIEHLQDLMKISMKPENQRLFSQKDCDDIANALEKKMEEVGTDFDEWAVKLEKNEG